MRAGIVLSGGNYKTDASFTGANCNTSDTFNWGDGINTTSCSTYFPIIHITGDVTLNGNQGQGILLVDGNVSVQGSYQFFGITMVKGSIGSAGGGSTAACTSTAQRWPSDVNLSTTNTLSGKATLLYSKLRDSAGDEQRRGDDAASSRGELGAALLRRRYSCRTMRPVSTHRGRAS